MNVETTTSQRIDPRDLLSEWANGSDEWVRYIVRHVLTGAGPLSSDEAAEAYALFRQEKAFDSRELPTEEPLATLESEDEVIEPLTLTSVANVVGVNALVEGGVIEPHAGLTILFGENGTGKTGYSRIFKALAKSRTADVILGDIEATAPKQQSAEISYTLGSTTKTYTWTGGQGIAPFTRMSIFDSPSVSFHVDDDLEYVYVPAALALFNHVIAGIKSVQSAIDQSASELRSGQTGILSRFTRTATVYPLIETLGASTDLEHLKSFVDTGDDIDTRVAQLRRTVAALEADTISAEIKIQQRVERVLTQASNAATTLADFNTDAYSREREALHGLQKDYRAFRDSLFEAADLPADPDDTWSAFVTAGKAYEAHLVELGVHDIDRCLYCRQPLDDAARGLINKYSEYLEDKITADITASKVRLDAFGERITSLEISDAATFAAEYDDSDDKPDYHLELDRTLLSIATVTKQLQTGASIDFTLTESATTDAATLNVVLTSTTSALEELRKQAATRTETLATKRKELVELEAAAELGKSWPLIEAQVRDAKEADRLTLLAKPMPGLLRAVIRPSKDRQRSDDQRELRRVIHRGMRCPASPHPRH